MILKNYVSAPIRKKRLSPTNKAKMEASQNKLVEKGGIRHRVESFKEVDHSKNRPKARLGFVKPIRNRLRKIKNFIKNRPSRAETGLAGKENGFRFHKKE